MSPQEARTWDLRLFVRQSPRPTELPVRDGFPLFTLVVVVLLLVPGCGIYLLGCLCRLCPVCGCLFFILSGGFCFGLKPLFLCFRGGVVRFSFFLGAFLVSCVFFFVGLCPLVINSYLSKKYVSFLSCFWPNIYFPCGRICSFYSSYF